jgi:signal transduction histidine kinase
LDCLIAAAAGAFDVSVYRNADTIGFRHGGFPVPIGIGLIVVGAAALVVRRRWPMASFVVAWCVAFSALIAPDLQPTAILLVALYGVAVSAGRYGAVLALVASIGALALSAVNSAPVGTVYWKTSWFFGTAAADILLPLAIWSFGRFRYRSLARISDLRREHDQALEVARRDERLMLSHELHDIVSHTVNVMTLQAAGARAIMDLDPSKVGPSLEIIERAGVQAMNELQRLLGVLRADGTDQTTATQPQLSDLPQLLETARSSGQTVELAINGSPGELDPSVELACYRIVQEALTNARKYAGPTAQVAVGMEWIPPQLVLTVRNAAGTASDQAVLSTGNGLAGLSERVRLVGGRLETEELPTGGFLVRATLPVASMRTSVAEAVPTHR